MCISRKDFTILHFLAEKPVILCNLMSVFAGDERFNLCYTGGTKGSRRLFFIGRADVVMFLLGRSPHYAMSQVWSYFAEE